MDSTRAEVEHRLEWARSQSRHVPDQQDIPALLEFMHDQRRSATARLCAASLLLDLDVTEARGLVEQYLRDAKPGSYHDALAVVNRRAFRAPDDKWASGLLLAVIDRDYAGVIETLGSLRESRPTSRFTDDDDATYVVPGRPPEDILSGWYHLVREFDRIFFTVARNKSVSAVGVLQRVIKANPNTDRAAHALGEIGDRSAIPALIEGLAAAHVQSRDYYVSALGKLRATAAVPVIADLLEESMDGGRDMSEVCVNALGRIGTRDSASALRKVAEGTKASREVRAIAEMYLAELAADDPGLALLERLRKATDPQARWRYLARLGELREPRAVPDVLALARHSENARDRCSYVQWLGRIGGARAVSGLVELLGSREAVESRGVLLRGFGTYEKCIARALKQATGVDFGTDAQAWKTWLENHVDELGQPSTEGQDGRGR